METCKRAEETATNWIHLRTLETKTQTIEEKDTSKTCKANYTESPHHLSRKGSHYRKK